MSEKNRRIRHGMAVSEEHLEPAAVDWKEAGTAAEPTEAAPDQSPEHKSKEARRTKADSTLRTSQAVPHPSTNRALCRLTSEVGRDPVHSTRYGRQRTALHASAVYPRCGRRGSERKYAALGCSGVWAQHVAGAGSASVSTSTWAAAWPGRCALRAQGRRALGCSMAWAQHAMSAGAASMSTLNWVTARLGRSVL